MKKIVDLDQFHCRNTFQKYISLRSILEISCNLFEALKLKKPQISSKWRLQT